MFLFSPCCCKIRFEQLWVRHNGVGLSHLLAFSTLISKCLFFFFFNELLYTMNHFSSEKPVSGLVCSWFTTIPLMMRSMSVEAWRAQNRTPISLCGSYWLQAFKQMIKGPVLEHANAPSWPLSQRGYTRKTLIHRDLHRHSPGWRCGNHGENHGEDDSRWPSSCRLLYMQYLAWFLHQYSAMYNQLGVGGSHSCPSTWEPPSDVSPLVQPTTSPPPVPSLSLHCCSFKLNSELSFSRWVTFNCPNHRLPVTQSL